MTAVDGANFPVAGIKPSRNQLTTGIGVSMVAGPNLSLYANYDATLPAGSGRGAGYPAPPPQIPACGFPAPGS